MFQHFAAKERKRDECNSVRDFSKLKHWAFEGVDKKGQFEEEGAEFIKIKRSKEWVKPIKDGWVRGKWGGDGLAVGISRVRDRVVFREGLRKDEHERVRRFEERNGKS